MQISYYQKVGVLADRGFDIDEDVARMQASLKMTASLCTLSSFFSVCNFFSLLLE